MSRMRSMIPCAVGLAVALQAGPLRADTPQAKTPTRQSAQNKAPKTAARADLNRAIAAWPAKPRAVTYMMIKKYGLPHEVTASHLVWHKTGPWKRTTLFRDELQHSFPKPHTDLLEQVIDANVPAVVESVA